MKTEPVSSGGGLSAWRLGQDKGHVVIGDSEGKVIAAFSAPQAAMLAALLIKHACIIAGGGGSKVVDKAIKETYRLRELSPREKFGETTTAADVEFDKRMAEIRKRLEALR